MSCCSKPDSQLKGGGCSGTSKEDASVAIVSSEVVNTTAKAAPGAATALTSKGCCASKKAAVPDVTDAPRPSCCSAPAKKACCPPRQDQPEPSPATSCCKPAPSSETVNPAACCSGTDEEKPASSCCSAKPTMPASTCGSPNEKAAASAAAKNSKGCCGKPMLSAEKAASSCCAPKSDVKDEVAKEDQETGCCGSNASAAGTPKSCCETEKKKEESESQQEAICPCCMPILLSGSARARVGPVVSIADLPRKLLGGQMQRLRRCCATVESFCKGKDCCYVPIAPPAKRRCGREAELGELEDDEDEKAELRVKDTKVKLTMDVGGMDCPDCANKVFAAFSRLASLSVASATLDYLSARATCMHDPEAISGASIARFVARATGFTITVIEGADLEEGRGSLPLRMARAPSAAELDALGIDLVPSSKRDMYLLHFDAASQRSRDVLRRLEPWAPELLPQEEAEGQDIVKRDLKRTALRAGVAATLCIPVLVLAWAHFPDHRRRLVSSLAMALATLIQVAGWPIITHSARSMFFLRTVDLGVLVAVSISVAWIFSLVSFAFELAGKPFAEPFWETSALLVTLIYAGRVVQGLTRTRTRGAVTALSTLQPTHATLAGEKDSGTVVDSRLVSPGDIIHLALSERVPVDGIVVRGQVELDTSSITGESVPFAAGIGASVSAGSLCVGGQADVQVTRSVQQSSLSQTAALVLEAQSARSSFHDLADRLAEVLLPVALASAVVAFSVWLPVGLRVRGQGATDASVEALTYSLAVIIVSCPCALALAIPLVQAAAVRRGLHRGILFRSPEALQTARKPTVVAFDKTGTLSSGTFAIHDAEVRYPAAGVEHLVAALVEGNEHPIARAVARSLKGHALGGGSVRVEQITSVPGKGIEGRVGDVVLRGGSAAFTGYPTEELIALTSAGCTLFTVTLGWGPLACFALADAARPEASALVADLAKRGIKVVILSGDNQGAVARLASAIGVIDARASCSPKHKKQAIAGLQASGERVYFVGDGSNDAPALAQADVSFAVQSGTDVAVASASAVLLGPDLRAGVLGAMDLGTTTHRHLVAALSWAVTYNVFAILLASGALVKVRIEPRWAGVGELVSLLPVILIAWHLQVRA